MELIHKIHEYFECLLIYYPDLSHFTIIDIAHGSSVFKIGCSLFILNTDFSSVNKLLVHQLLLTSFEFSISPIQKIHAFLALYVRHIFNQNKIK